MVSLAQKLEGNLNKDSVQTKQDSLKEDLASLR